MNQVFRDHNSGNYRYRTIASGAKINLFRILKEGQREEQVITQEPLSETDILLKFGKNVTPEEIQQLSNKIVTSPYKTVIIDLSEVYHLNYAVLGKLHMLKLDLTVRSKRLAFQGCSDRLYNMLKLLKFDKTIEILRLSPQERPKTQEHQTNTKQPKRGKML
jgi:anti-anti-sigma regulatory factor